MKVDHIAIYVEDLEKVRQFFVEHFGALANGMYHNTRTGLRSYFLSFDGDCRVEVMSRPEVHAEDFDEYRAGYTHLSFAVGGKKAVDSLTARLKACGYEVLSGPRTTGDGYYESSIRVIGNLIVEICE